MSHVSDVHGGDILRVKVILIAVPRPLPYLFPAACVLFYDLALLQICPDIVVTGHGASVFQLIINGDVICGQHRPVSVVAALTVDESALRHDRVLFLFLPVQDVGQRIVAVALDAVFQSHSVEGGDSPDVFLACQLQAVKIQGHGADVLHVRNAILNAQHVKAGSDQAHGDHGGQNPQADPAAQLEHPGGALQEHLSAEPTGGAAAEQEQIHHGHAGANFGCKEGFHAHNDQRTGHHGADQLKQRLQNGERNGIPGAFQVPLPVQQQPDKGKNDAHRRIDQQGCILPPVNAERRHHLTFPAVEPQRQLREILHGHILAAGHTRHGRQQPCPPVRRDHAEEHGRIKGIDNIVENIRAAVQNRVHHRHGEAVSGAEHAEDRHTEEGDELQVGAGVPQKRDLPCVCHHGRVQQRHGQQRHHRRGDHGKQQSGNDIGQKQRLPAHGHGVQSVAHPGVIQVAEQQHGDERRKKQVHQPHELKVPGYPGSKPERPSHIPIVLVQHHHSQNQTQGVSPDHRGEPGQVLQEYGLIKEGCL